MNRQIAFAYGIAGLAVAVAFIAVVGSTAGLFDSGQRNSEQAVYTDPGQPAVLAPAPAPAAYAPGQVAPAYPAPLDGGLVQGGAGGVPEVVYVDAPVRGRRGEHEREEHEGRDHDEDDDD